MSKPTHSSPFPARSSATQTVMAARESRSLRPDYQGRHRATWRTRAEHRAARLLTGGAA